MLRRTQDTDTEIFCKYYSISQSLFVVVFLGNFRDDLWIKQFLCTFRSYSPSDLLRFLRASVVADVILYWIDRVLPILRAVSEICFKFELNGTGHKTLLLLSKAVAKCGRCLMEFRYWCKTGEPSSRLYRVAQFKAYASMTSAAVKAE